MLSLSDKMRKTFALWRSTDNDGERQAARAALQRMANDVGATFGDIFNLDDAERRPTDDAAASMFWGFDDFQEMKEPGYKAQCAWEIAAKSAARAARKKALIEKYGSVEAGLEPCDRERLILIAVKPWRKASKRPHQRWTHSLDGWHDGISQTIPPHVDAAIRGAYSLPATFAEARAEADYWRLRMIEMEDLLDDRYGDCALDLVAETRMRIVERLIESELVAKTPADVLIRFKLYLDREFSDRDTEIAIFKDLERIVTAGAADMSSAPGADISTHEAAHDGATRRSPVTVQREQIAAAILADASRTDRSIARELGCSPTTVGKVRAAAGLNGASRSVQRAGQTFEARYGRGRGDSPTPAKSAGILDK